MHYYLLLTACLAACLAGAGALPADVRQWSVEDVQTWITETELPESMKEVVSKHGVSGKVLLFVDERDLEDEFSISSALQRKKILMEIKELADTEEETPSKFGGDGGHALTFWEYRSMNRYSMHKIYGLFVGAPRWALSLLESEWPAHARPEKPIGSYMEWFFIPEYYIFLNRNVILGGLPGMFAYLVVAKFGAQAAILALLLIRMDMKGLVQYISKMVATEIFMGIFNWLWMLVLFPITPWFLSDLGFNLSIYFWPVLGILGTLNEARQQLTKQKTD